MILKRGILVLWYQMFIIEHIGNITVENVFEVAAPSYSDFVEYGSL